MYMSVIWLTVGLQGKNYTRAVLARLSRKYLPTRLTGAFSEALHLSPE
jgi:hypothetical protein